jgi:hypothetical protein
LILSNLRFFSTFIEITSKMDENEFSKTYREKADELLKALDFAKIEEVRKKELKDLTEEDLVAVGFTRITHDEIDNIYSFEDLDHVKIYVNKVADKFELRGYMLRKTKDILTTAELFDETLSKWKLNM